MTLWGLDCTYPDCNHDSVKGYRLRFAIYRSQDCMSCTHHGTKMPAQKGFKGEIEDDWYECHLCDAEWRSTWKTERNDYVFYPQQLVSAYSQMAILGTREPALGIHYIERHRTLPRGFIKRRLILTQEAMPKLSIYFRRKPTEGEEFTPDLVFQGMFPSNASAEERRQAWAQPIQLHPEEIAAVLNIQQTPDGPRSVSSITMLNCQHCHRPIPTKALNTGTLRSCDFGD